MTEIWGRRWMPWNLLLWYSSTGSWKHNKCRRYKRKGFDKSFFCNQIFHGRL